MCIRDSSHLAVRQDALNLLFQLLWRELESLRRSTSEQGPLEFGIGRQPARLRLFITEFGTPEQHEAGLRLLGQGNHRSGGYAAGSTRHDDHITMVDATRVGGHLPLVRDDRDPTVRATQTHFQFRSAGQDLLGEAFGDGNRGLVSKRNVDG